MTALGRLKIVISLLLVVTILHITQFTSTILEKDYLSRKNDQDEMVISISSPLLGQHPTVPADAGVDGVVASSYNRHSLLEENDTSGLKIVAFTDFDYIPVAKWWYRRMTSLGYKTHVLVVIDHTALGHFQKINVNGMEYYRVETKIVDPGKRRKNKVRSLWYNRILYCLTELQKGQSLLLTDVDNIFSRYEPLSQFLGSSYDVIFALEGKFPSYIFRKQGFVVCGGLIFLKATKSTIQMMEMLLDRCDGGTKRCDDQVEWNKLLTETMTWNNSKSKLNKTDDGLLQYGFDGVSHVVKGFKAKVWDRDFAWRGPFDTEHCPSKSNWVSMPGNLPSHAQKQIEKVKRGLTKNIGLEKMARVAIWEAFCGTNGTNRDREKSIDDRLDKALRSYGEWQTVDLPTK